MEVKFLQFIRDAPKKPLKTVKMIYDERFVDYLSKIMLVHFMTREDRLKVFHDVLEWQYFCEICALSTLLCDRSLKAANFGSSTSSIHHFHYKSVPVLGLKGLKNNTLRGVTPKITQ